MNENLTQAELMVAVSKLNTRNVAHEARAKYSNALWPEATTQDVPQTGVSKQHGLVHWNS